MRNSTANRHRWFRILAFVVLLGADQFTKFLAAKHLRGQGNFVVVPKVLEFSYWENTGAVFSSFQGMNVFLIIGTILLLGFVASALLRIPNARKWLPLQYAIMLLLAGGCGNLIDRIVRGYVIDFIAFVPVSFPKFNLADSYIVIAIALWLLLALGKYKDSEVLDFFLPGKKKG